MLKTRYVCHLHSCQVSAVDRTASSFSRKKILWNRAIWRKLIVYTPHGELFDATWNHTVDKLSNSYNTTMHSRCIKSPCANFLRLRFLVWNSSTVWIQADCDQFPSFKVTSTNILVPTYPLRTSKTIRQSFFRPTRWKPCGFYDTPVHFSKTLDHRLTAAGSFPRAVDKSAIFLTTHSTYLANEKAEDCLISNSVSWVTVTYLQKWIFSNSKIS